MHDKDLIEAIVSLQESRTVETKRVAGEKLTRALETIVAFANTDGGWLVLGIEDIAKTTGHDRIYGIQENPNTVDELRRLVDSKITPSLILPAFSEIKCALRDGSPGSIVVVRVPKSETIHSIVLDGTWQRLDKGNKELVAEEITRLTFERGIVSAESRLADIDFDLLNTDFWKMYASMRRLTRPISEALQHLGLAKISADGKLKPTWAAVLLFATEPGGLLAHKGSIRIFHYHGDQIEAGATPNLQKPPKTIGGPLIYQIREAYRTVLDSLASGIQMGSFGFEIIQKYPARVVKEAITNAVIHRDYSIPSDIHIRIFSNRIEVISPGALPGKVTERNIHTIGSFNRNPLIVSNLREFQDPPNLDAGEGVRMMFHTMEEAGLYPPQYLTRTTTGRDEVRVILLNENRPTIWDQVLSYLEKHGTIGNSQVRQIMKTNDTLTASKTLKKWVERGLLEIVNPERGKRIWRYQLPGTNPIQPLFATQLGKQL